MAAKDYSEDTLIEQPAIKLFDALGWRTANLFREKFGANATLGRETTAEVVLVPRLRAAIERLNPGLSSEAVNAAIEELTRDHSTQALATANRDVCRLVRDGVKVSTRMTNEDGDEEERAATVQVIDWAKPESNDFFLASQLWVSGEIYKRRADLIGFVNGLPLVFVELKAAHKRLHDAYKDNLRDYKTAIPQLFWYNAIVILSNGSQSKIGSLTAEWEHFNEWKRISDEEEQGIVSLETMLRGVCEPSRLLDLIENFTLFSEAGVNLVKVIAKNHQFLGVNNAIEAVRDIRGNQGRLGVFWHTQGSGKSLSMVFFAQKVLRRLPGNWTFLVVTDRQELDEQIYQTFASVGAVATGEVQATSGEHLKQLLREDQRYIFTLIQKFRTDGSAAYPQLSDRSDIIVITDEAHRSQYDIFAANMRQALPNAAFIGFTGTPLMAGEELTREVFGDYVSVYDFKQSIEDGATVPLYYENRIPELELTNDELNEDMNELLERAELDDAQEAKLEREFSREYHLLTRDDRLEKIAQDIVSHFTSRGTLGKALVVSVDKATAVRVYNKVQKHWRARLAELEAQLVGAENKEVRRTLETLTNFMRETDMAAVISQSQNEVEDFSRKGLDITPHRRRMVTEDLAAKFKRADDPLRIVFVCAMWMTGFDVPSCSTIYLDKPMRNHTLMQTIARANRVFEGKTNGLIVDYVGVFRNLQKALAIYAPTEAGGTKEELPVKDKAELVKELKIALTETDEFCIERGVEVRRLIIATGLERVRLLDDAVEAILIDAESKRRFLSLAAHISRLYKAILPDPLATEFTASRTALAVLSEKIRLLQEEANIEDVIRDVETLLDESIAAEGYVIKDSAEGLIDLSRIDFAELKRRFDEGRKRTEAELLKLAIKRKLKSMVQVNKSRADYVEKFQEMIDEYNAGSSNVETLFNNLLNFTAELNAEDKRAIAEELTEEELAVFDLLTRPNVELNDKERREVKRTVRELLAKLKREQLVLDWRKRQQARADVRLSIEETLETLPAAYTDELYQNKCDAVYQHVYDSYLSSAKNIYLDAQAA